jgi:SAM-dependent methyltransferase
MCNCHSVEPWFVKNSGTSHYPVVRCRSCHSAFVWPRPDASAVLDLYSDSDYSPSHDRDGIYWPTAETDAKRLIGTFGRYAHGKVLLDIGAGEGVASAEAIAQGFTVRACEPSPQCRMAFATRNGFEPESSFFDTEFAERNRHQIDVVLMSHVLEHLSDTEKLLNDVSIVLRPGGIMIIAVPLLGSIVTAVMGEKDFFITPPEHLNFFSAAGMEQLLKKHGYSLESKFTSSKVNLQRYRNLLGPASYVLNYAAYGVMKMSELVNRSIVLSVCARKVSAPCE